MEDIWMNYILVVPSIQEFPVKTCAVSSKYSSWIFLTLVAFPIPIAFSSKNINSGIKLDQEYFPSS